MGRYEKSYSGERRTEKMTVQLTPSERAELDAGAALHGATMSEYARGLLLSRSGAAYAYTARRRNPEAKAIMDALHAAGRELQAIGNNLNQIARHLNTTGELRDWGELREALALFEKGEALHKAAVGRILDSVGIA